MRRLLAILLAVGVLICVTGCGGDDKDKKYDVTIKIVSDCGDICIFTPDIEEMHIEIPYDGRERRFYVDKYQLSDHPRYGDTWFTPNGHNDFQTIMQSCPPGGNLTSTDNRIVQERGEYRLIVTTEIYGDENLWRFREVYLCITVK